MACFTDKIMPRSDVPNIAVRYRSSGKTIGFTNGCFDILHPGHVRYLEKAGSECDLLVVGVNSDRSVRSIKGPARPVNDEMFRCEVLAGLASVGIVTLFDEDTPLILIEQIMPDVIFKGGDWKEVDIAGANEVKNNGGKVMIIPFEDGFSTTRIISRVKKTGK